MQNRQHRRSIRRRSNHELHAGQDPRGARDGQLAIWEIEAQLWLIPRAALLHIARNGNDLEISHVGIAPHQASSDRIRARKQPLRHRLVDGDNPRRQFVVLFCEVAPRNQVNPHRREVRRADDVPARARITVGDWKSRWPNQVGAAVSSEQHTVLRVAGGRDARHRPDTFQQSVSNGHSSLGFVTGGLWIHVEDNQAFRHEAKIDVPEIHQSTKEESGAHQQHE